MTDFDDILKQVGEFGSYQRWIFFVCLNLFSFHSAFNTMGIVFLAATPDHWCLVPSLQHLNVSRDTRVNLTIPLEERNGEQRFSQCRRYEVDYSNWTEVDVQTALQEGGTRTAATTPCDQGWEYDTSTYQTSMAMEWELVCDRRALVATASSVFMLGLMVGGSVYGLISDWYGRKVAYVASLIMVVVSGLLTIVSPSYEMLIFCRFLMGAGGMGNSLASYILGVELVGPSWRVFVGVAGSYFWAAFLILTAGIAYFFRTWKTLALVYHIPQIISLITIFFLPESPRWLYSQNKHDRAEKVVRKMARCNGVELPEKLEVEIKKDPSTGVFLDLVRHKTLRWKLLNMCFQWFTVSMVYYGLTLGMSNLAGDPYVNFMVGAALEIPSTLFAQLIIQYMGRKKIHIFCMVVCGAVLLAMTLVPRGMTALERGLPMAGRFFINAAFMTIYIYSAELFPTVVRNVAMSTCSFAARIGGVIAPYLASLMGVSRLIPYISLGTVAVAAGLLSLFLPETKGKKLPERIEDVERLSRENATASGEETERVQLEEKGGESTEDQT